MSWFCRPVTTLLAMAACASIDVLAQGGAPASAPSGNPEARAALSESDRDFMRPHVGTMNPEEPAAVLFGSYTSVAA